MGQPEQLTISLPDHLLEFVQAKVARGEFTSENEFILHAVESLRLDEEELKQWEVEVATPACDRLMANPESGIPSKKSNATLKNVERADCREKSSARD